MLKCQNWVPFIAFETRFIELQTVKISDPGSVCTIYGDFSKLTEILYPFCLVLDKTAIWGSNLTDLCSESYNGVFWKVITLWMYFPTV